MNWIDKYNQDMIELGELELSPDEEDVIARLEARIRVHDPSWGDSLNDRIAIERVVLAARREGQKKNV